MGIDEAGRCRSYVRQCTSASASEAVRDEVDQRSPLSASTSRSCPFVFGSVPRRSSQQFPPANKDNKDASWMALSSKCFFCRCHGGIHGFRNWRL